MNDDITLQQTDASLFVEILASQNKAVIKGNSFVPDPKAFYSEILNWARRYRQLPVVAFSVEITPGYYSTSNIQVINLFLRTLIGSCNQNIDIVFNIRSEEAEDMEETMSALMFNTWIAASKQYF